MKALAEQIEELDGAEIHGRVVGVRGLMVEVAGPIHAMSVGARVVIETGHLARYRARWWGFPTPMRC
jgi:flagellum-specific ATP synthase